MANLWTGTVDFDGYKTITELSGITFEADTTYTIQVNGAAILREGEAGEGFIINTDTPFQYTAGVDDLYIAKEGDNHTIRINIAE